MHIKRFQSIVLRLANQMPVMYFLHPEEEYRKMTLRMYYRVPYMKIPDGDTTLGRELIGLGFQRSWHSFRDGWIEWCVQRTEQDEAADG